MGTWERYEALKLENPNIDEIFKNNQEKVEAELAKIKNLELDGKKYDLLEVKFYDIIDTLANIDLGFEFRALEVVKFDITIDWYIFDDFGVIGADWCEITVNDDWEKVKKEEGCFRFGDICYTNSIQNDHDQGEEVFQVVKKAFLS